MSSNLFSKKHFDILIVEDEPILAMAMEVRLKRLGFGIAGIATTPDNAILHTNNHHPDLAIIDINLNASKNGIDVASYMWKNFNIPIIFLTSYYNDKILSQAMEAEPYAYLIKPCKNEELKVAINTVLHKHQFFFKNKNLIKTTKNKFIQIDENIKFDLINLELYVNEEIIKLTKTEKKLFEILASQNGKIVSFDAIFNYIWREDVYDLSKLRSLIYRVKTKLNFNPFENLYEEGYRIRIFEKTN
ncbi:response regulator [Aliarcobacter butzleri]|uniref:DNA-binding response regulator n=1 Tax=Arcobacter lacus TaxID=1912876 RepID=A0ABX5JM90_9BACT|nr:MULTISPECIES: response regulator [Arcobacteraceae]MCT7554594.1 response regulator [Aliarcobacter butzleri]MCT7579668.1 response regulator [Aliarcobacter butzleri]MDN5076963.1 response regulator [Aliarcobacter butzleri]MDN5118209.1 response regulator [Aliarcobacter butzleri]PUE67456.1 DNA-binding response regulator [Arcobacter lacus]